MSLENKDSINIITPVIIKSVVTEELIQSINNRISESLESLKNRLNQIQYQKEFITMQSKQQEISKEAVESINKAESEIKAQVKKIEDQARQVESWELGQEVIMTQKESIRKFSIGDTFVDNRMSEIVVKNGKIIKIRE